MRARLAHRRGAGEHEQRREDPEPDEVAEGEVDDPGQPVDQRVPGREQPVDPTRGKPGDEDLQRDRHGGTLSGPRDGWRERPQPLDADSTRVATLGRWQSPPSHRSPTSQMATLAALGEERTAGVGDVLYRVGDATYPFIAIQEGEVAILDAAGNELVRHGASSFLGELNLLSGQTVFVTALVTEPLRYIAVERDALRDVLFDDGPLSDLVLSTFIARREALQTRPGPRTRDRRASLVRDDDGDAGLRPCQPAAVQLAGHADTTRSGAAARSAPRRRRAPASVAGRAAARARSGPRARAARGGRPARRRRRPGGPDRRGLRSLRGPRHADRREHRAGRPGRLVAPDRELPRLPGRHQRHRAHQPGRHPGAQVRRAPRHALPRSRARARQRPARRPPGRGARDRRTRRRAGDREPRTADFRWTSCTSTRA